MYIAFRWLFGLASAMWVTMCCIDFHYGMVTKNTALELPFLLESNSSFKIKQFEIDFIEKLNTVQQKESNFPIYHYIMFFTGFVLLLFLHKKQDILVLARKVYELNVSNSYFDEIRVKLHLNNTSEIIGVAILKITAIIWEIISSANMFFKRKIQFRSHTVKHNLTLFKRFKELNEERRNLGKLLLTTIRENKNMRIRYQLENLAKNRLARYIEDTEKVAKENRCQYVSFQQLYLATHQENIFLKSRIKKLTNERDNAERNLITLVNEVCKYKNKELKAFCCQFIVETKGNLLNNDVKGEIRKFLNNSERTNIISEESLAETKSEYYDRQITDIMDNGCIIVSEAPKLRGLPGEYVWTVKDKNGLIEKVYEYNFQTNFDNGDTIRRIRQYSVYCDKDCLLDYKSSRTSINDSNVNDSEIGEDCKIKHNIDYYPITRHKFLTGSQAFQKFLKHNGNVVHCS